MSNKCTVAWCDLSKYTLNFGLNEILIETYPALNIALCALSKILTNNHLLINFNAHFIPFNQYNGRFSENVPDSILKQMMDAFSQQNIPSIILEDDLHLISSESCAVYGSYLGRQKVSDEQIIYINKQLIDCSKITDHPNDIIKYGALILFSILHELGHWSFHHFSCNMDHDLSTPKGVLMEEAGDAIEFLMFGFRIQHYGPSDPKFMIDEIVTHFNNGYRIVPLDYLKTLFEESTYLNVKDYLFIQISIIQLRQAAILDEELSKLNLKRVFVPNDEPKLEAATNDTTIEPRKRVFNSRDKY